MKALGLVLLAAASLAACNPTLTAQSIAPPGRSMVFDSVDGWWGNTKYYRLEMSEGVAFAVTCEDGGPCEKLVATSDDPNVAEVRPAALQKLATDFRGNNQTQFALSAVVIVGKHPGMTTIRLRSKDGNRDVKVTIVPPPVLGTPATVASPAPLTSQAP
ncbi:MAG TPA: hypothetical protein VIU61_28590 [Kofleriaceae bacterium]